MTQTDGLETPYILLFQFIKCNKARMWTSVYLNLRLSTLALSSLFYSVETYISLRGFRSDMGTSHMLLARATVLEALVMVVVVVMMMIV